MAYIFRKYRIHFILVVVLIFVGVLANVQGTLFMQKLIDDAKAGKADDMMKKLSPKDTETVKRILNDEESLKKILAMPQAQQLLKLFNKGE